MNSAKALGLVVISIVLTGFAGVQVRAGDAPPATFTKCAKACADCQLACDACFHHCTELTAGGAKEHAVTLQLYKIMADCAKSCDSCAKACREMIEQLGK